VEAWELHESVRCSRRLPMTSRAAAQAVLRLHHDEPGGRVRWRLGDRGSFELDTGFERGSSARAPAGSRRHRLHTAGRLWDPAGMTMTGVDVEIAPSDGDVELTLVPAQKLPSWFRDHDLAHWRELAAAAIDELGEELLWHARRTDHAS
jgi:hypothetical protein